MLPNMPFFFKFSTQMRTPFTKNYRLIKSAALVIGALILTSCTIFRTPSATAQLKPTIGNNVSGTVNFIQRDNKVVVNVDIQGLPPSTEHGFHVHEKGDCSSGDGMSTGGHFNPTAKEHAAHAAMNHHAGDLPSLTSDLSGRVKLSFESTSFSVVSGETSVVGRGLIVHRDADDYKTQPTGNSGPRVACAVIQADPRFMGF